MRQGRDPICSITRDQTAKRDWADTVQGTCWLPRDWWMTHLYSLLLVSMRYGSRRSLVTRSSISVPM
jgi:hypothetical protein